MFFFGSRPPHRAVWIKLIVHFGLHGSWTSGWDRAARLLQAVASSGSRWKVGALNRARASWRTWMSGSGWKVGTLNRAHQIERA
ncbi:hypothetical protein DY000_02052367 [Brassica cretica]|uniref:Uncharacterized protein n=1 Tax=Brassica cretica TaxID=69181 RepID=A0ABQ7AFQ8_BRACR|nr:hypothetical protein DY000_02052367 [Brassica cretica]